MWSTRASATFFALALPFVMTGQRWGEPQSRGFANPGYDGRFTFTRIQYGSGWGRRGGGSWAHDWPDGDLNLHKILEFMTFIRINTDGSNVLTLDDPEIFRTPIIYVSEPGYWTMTESEALALRQYLLKGGFVILDDFEVDQLDNAFDQIQRALPDARLIEIGPDHPIFDVFFKVENIYIPHPMVRVTPVYYAVFEDNDPSKRMIALLNHNNDLAEYWEWSATGAFPVDFTNEAYKIGVNYIVWGMTH